MWCHAAMWGVGVGKESNVWTPQGRYKGHDAACGEGTKCNLFTTYKVDLTIMSKPDMY